MVKTLTIQSTARSSSYGATKLALASMQDNTIANYLYPTSLLNKEIDHDNQPAISVATNGAKTAAVTMNNMGANTDYVLTIYDSTSGAFLAGGPTNNDFKQTVPTPAGNPTMPEDSSHVSVQGTMAAFQIQNYGVSFYDLEHDIHIADYLDATEGPTSVSLNVSVLGSSAIVTYYDTTSTNYHATELTVVGATVIAGASFPIDVTYSRSIKLTEYSLFLGGRNSIPSTTQVAVFYPPYTNTSTPALLIPNPDPVTNDNFGLSLDADLHILAVSNKRAAIIGNGNRNSVWVFRLCAGKINYCKPMLQLTFLDSLLPSNLGASVSVANNGRAVYATDDVRNRTVLFYGLPHQ